MSYGPSLPAMWEQSATIVVKVLKSAKPSRHARRATHQSRAGCQPKDCKAIGLTAPSTLLAVCDDVID